MQLTPVQTPYIQELTSSILKDKEIRLFIKREDVIHPAISGNKWHKLKLNLKEARKKNFETVLSFGGAYSNHIYALAAAAGETGFKSIGVIRGEPTHPLNPTLQFASDRGMKLHFISRSDYQLRSDPSFIRFLEKLFGDFYMIPEGGTNSLAVEGAGDIINEDMIKFSYICCPVGTGGTLAGLICRLKGKSQIIGIPVLKGDFLVNQIEILSKDNCGSYDNWQLVQDYHFGGYAKFDPHLIEFINDFKKRFSIQLDPIYTGKMMFAIFDLAKKSFFKKGSRIVAIHTGGLQGIAGFNNRFGGLLD